MGLAGLGGPALLSAQTASSNWGDASSRDFIMIGYQALDLDALNARLVGPGLPQSSNNFLTIGVADFRATGPFLVGVEGHYVVGSDEQSGALETRIGGGQLQLTVGYDAYSTESLSIYPAVGLGGGSFDYEFWERGDLAFDDVLTTPVRLARMNALGVLLGRLGFRTPWYGQGA